MNEYLWLESDSSPTKPFYPRTIDGKGFRVNGQRHQYISVTAFSLVNDFFLGKDIIPFVDYAFSLGNTLRIFLSCKQMFNLDPRYYGYNSYYDALAYIHTLAEQRGGYVENTIFADRALFTDWHDGSTLSFYNNMVTMIASFVNGEVELVNEADQPENKLNISLYPKPMFELASNGSNGEDADPIIGWSNKLNFHPARTPDWPRKMKSSREFQDKYNIPCVNDEINKPEQYGYNISDAKDAGYCSALLCSGFNLHSNDLRYCTIPTDERIYNCLRASSEAAKYVNPEIQFGQYTRGGLSDCPMYHTDDIATRTFAIIQGNRAYCIIIQPKPDNPRKAINGWSITSNRDNYYELAR